MESLKMSDIWGWDSIPQNYGKYEAFTFNGTDRKGDFYGFLFCTEEAAEGVAHAVRNHDRLVEENAELREALEQSTEILGNFWSNTGSLGSLRQKKLNESVLDKHK